MAVEDQELMEREETEEEAAGIEDSASDLDAGVGPGTDEEAEHRHLDWEEAGLEALEEHLHLDHDVYVENEDGTMVESLMTHDALHAAAEATAETQVEDEPGTYRTYTLTLPSGKVIETSLAEFKLAGSDDIAGTFPDEGDVVEGTWRGVVQGIHLDRPPKKPRVLQAVVKVTSATLVILPKVEQPPLPWDQPAKPVAVDLTKILNEHTATCQDCVVDEADGTVLVRCEMYDQLVGEYVTSAGDAEEGAADESALEETGVAPV